MLRVAEHKANKLTFSLECLSPRHPTPPCGWAEMTEATQKAKAAIILQQQWLWKREAQGTPGGRGAIYNEYQCVPRRLADISLKLRSCSCAVLENSEFSKVMRSPALWRTRHTNNKRPDVSTMMTRLWQLDWVHKTCVVSTAVDTLYFIILSYFLF